ncbi:uncharacterized protein LOC116351033 [Contarinia nasturtii]|uniref:uncharacterized protein LOC116351033 n=1 Tax=Contarinia nasturtii TaxID=265458 RepID=UPI0012D3849B|nr:uncharacterized protein LOC116351033 [Contarinia nasturtii]
MNTCLISNLKLINNNNNINDNLYVEFIELTSLIIVTEAQIAPLEEFHTFLEKCLHKHVLEYIVKPLTRPGDNFASVIQALEVKTINNNDPTEIEMLNLVFKKPIPGFVNTYQSEQFLSEVHFYTDIIPAIKQFEESLNIPETERIEAFARYFGSRISLNPGAERVDMDAIILFENLKSLNYHSPSQFDKDDIFAILKILAKLHALCIAMRRLQPHLFYSNVDPYLHNVYSRSFLDTIKFTITDKFIEKELANFSEMPKSVQIAIKDLIKLCKNLLRNQNRIPDTPYTTFYHTDLWSKNILIKKDGTNKNYTQVKIVDFQLYRYDTFVHDLVQFLLINARINDLKTNFKSFIEYYHLEFVKTMRYTNCPLNDYTYEKIWKEIKDKAKYNLLDLYYYLAKRTIIWVFYMEQPTPKAIVNRLKCINDLYVENGLI